MSNFAFMNNEQFLKHPGCRRLYEYAISAEEYYRVDHEKCAMRVRFLLEQACVLGSELKHASYPQKISVLGDFWNKQNYFEFLRVFEGNISHYIQRANVISRSYLHTGLLQGSVPREDIYPEMLENVYKITLWLYKSLGYETSCIYSDYSEDKIPVGNNIQTYSRVEESRDIYYSSDDVLQNFKKYFPNANTESLCTVEQHDDVYIVKDLEGRIVSEFVRKEDYEVSEEEKLKIMQNLEMISKEYKNEKKKFIKTQKEKDEQINSYAMQIVAVQNESSDLKKTQEIQLENLKTDIQRLKDEKEQAAEAYKKKISQLGAEYDELYDRYTELVPAEEQRQQLHKQVLELLEERRSLESAFREKENDLLAEIEGLKTRIYTIKRDLKDAYASTEEGQSVISSLEKALQEKEQSLVLFQKEAEQYFKRLQAETADLIKSYKDKAANLEIILTNVMMENAEYKEKLELNNVVKETTALVQIIKGNVGEIVNAFAVYKQDENEQKLRMLLLKVKAKYEEEIYNLERELRKKEEELERERLEKERILHEIWKAKQMQNMSGSRTVNSNAASKSSGGNRKKKVLFSLIISILVLLAVLAKAILTPQQPNEDDKGGNIIVQNNMNDDVVIQDDRFEENSETEMIENMDSEHAEDTENDESVERTENTEETMDTEELDSTEMDSSKIEETENENPDKLDELLSDREWANSRPKDLGEIPNIHTGLKTFVESEYFINYYDEFCSKLELLGKADIYSVANKDASIYTLEEYEWITFCWETGGRNDPGCLIMYMEPSIVSSDLSRSSTRTEIVEMLGEPTTIYYDIGWSDFNFQEIEDRDIMYEWKYIKTGYSVNLRFIFDGERILDYCQVIIDVD